MSKSNYIEDGKEHVIPFYDIKVGFDCDCNCVHCAIGDLKYKPNFSFQELKEIIDTVPSATPIQLTGGEPSIRKDFKDTCEYIFNTGHKLAIQTNGYGLVSSKLDWNKYKSQVEYVLISFHSLKEDIHTFISKNPKSHGRAVESIRKLNDEGIKVSIKIVVHKLNMTTLYDTIKFLKSINSQMEIAIAYPHVSGNVWDNKDIVPSYTELKPYIFDIATEFYDSVRFLSIPPCHLPSVPNLDVICTDLSMKEFSRGNQGIETPEDHEDGISDNGFVSDYNLLFVNAYKKTKRCSLCIFDKVCTGVDYRYLEMFDDIYPIMKYSKNIINLLGKSIVYEGS
jgi:MoaA/NifB/PqqE/SkfB family radical SAM enzyme